MAKNKKYQEFQLEQLRDLDEAVAYLNTALEESLKGDVESQHLLLIALQNVVEAQVGLSDLAKKTHLGSESLYKIRSGVGNPKWHALVSLCVAMGMNLKIVKVV